MEREQMAILEQDRLDQQEAAEQAHLRAQGVPGRQYPAGGTAQTDTGYQDTLGLIRQLSACVQQMAVRPRDEGGLRSMQLKIQMPKTFNGSAYDMPGFESKFRSYASIHKQDGPAACEVLYT